VATGDKEFDDFANAMEIDDLTDPAEGQEEPAEQPVVEEVIDEPDGVTPPVEQAPSATVEEPTAPPPSAAAPPDELARVREQNDAYRKQVEEFQRQQEVAQLDAWEQQVKQSFLSTYGLTDDQAGLLAKQQRQAAEQVYQAQKAQELAVQNERGRYNAALHYAKQYGVEASTLLGLNTPEDMEREAKHMKEVNDLRKEIDGMKKASVPAGQKFDNGRSTPAPRDDEDYWLDQYLAGNTSDRAVAAGKKAAGL
jgi:hypothetical protein